MLTDMDSLLVVIVLLGGTEGLEYSCLIINLVQGFPTTKDILAHLAEDLHERQVKARKPKGLA